MLAISKSTSTIVIMKKTTKRLLIVTAAIAYILIVGGWYLEGNQDFNGSPYPYNPFADIQR